VQLSPGASRGAAGGGFLVVDGEVVARARPVASSSVSVSGADHETGGILQNIGEQELKYGPPVNVTIRPARATVFCSHTVAGSGIYQPTTRGLSRAHDHPSALEAEKPAGVLLRDVDVNVMGADPGSERSVK